ncbi:LysR substrate-binding domain-containing protein [Dyella caseinilytica]|uniref:LysR family transcriptional regulator n=1 Tax=Dyella caseinilytica TaxID=1849581 RepID=A0ABX7GU93_9GAMM|nr:LysR substrate-binding domain-containing protein [Dyella caseinilytica]QRN54034.1 LysR family transcriptional regulator [Dyella caseinilytica]GFZ91103.1 LysR family transcriptional regulator [Dyella caseinilytica]
MTRVNLDLDVLRSFATGIELGSFAKAADRLNRSTSAVSAQLKKLEDQAGTSLLRKSGRGMALTEAGEVMLSYARRLLELNDEAVSAVRGVQLEGRVRLGLQEDFGESLLPEVLGRFKRAHPRLRVEVQLARNTVLMQSLQTGRLDLALAWETSEAVPHAEHVHILPMCWIVGGNEQVSTLYGHGEPVPLVVLEAPCMMRTAATQALDHVGIPWRVAFTSPSLAGNWAAVKAGLGVSVRTPLGLPADVRTLDAHETDLPVLPQLGLALYRSEAEPEPAVGRLAELIMEKLRESIAA